MTRSAAWLAWTLSLPLGCDPSPEGTDPPEPTPPRIVSLGPELSALLVELGVGPGVVGADSASLALPGLARARDLGDAEAPSLVRARGLHPELVLVLDEPSGSGAALARTLEAEGVAAHVLAPRNADEVIASVHRVGRLVGRELRAASVAARRTRAVSQLATRRDGRPRSTVAWVLEAEPLVVVGSSGLLHELLELAGAENAFHTPGRERLPLSAQELAECAAEIALVPPGFALSLPRARSLAIAPALAALPLLDLPGRVRALHELLYPETGPPP